MPSRWIVLLCVCLFQLPVAVAAEKRWIEGTWEKTIDPNNNPKDYLRFDAKGGVALLNAIGRTASHGHYVMKGAKITLSLPQRIGPAVTVQLTSSADHQKLLFTPTSPGARAATYERVKP